MDPDANLKEQREIAKRIVDGDDLTHEEWDALRDRLAELVLALDEWLTKGGFLPGDWTIGADSKRGGRQ